MSVTLKNVFDTLCGHVDINTQFLKKIKAYQISFVTKNADHIRFFGGNLTGVDVVRFKDEDVNRWFDEIIETDERDLEEQIALVEDVNQDFAVAGSTFNISCAWVAYAISSSKHLNDTQKHDGLIDLFLILQYKFITSLLYHYFKYPASKEVAEATYAELNYRFALKQHGSWSALLKARAEDIIKPTGIHHNTIKTFSPDTKVVYLLGDTQGSLRSMLKSYYAVFDTVVKSGRRIDSVNAVVEHDGVEILRDRTHALSRYVRYVHSIIGDRNSFIKNELLTVIEKAVSTMPVKLFTETLNWMSDNAKVSRSNDIEDVINETLIHAFDYFSQNRSVIQNTSDLPAMLFRLRGVYMSSRSTDAALFQLRAKTEKLVQIATGNKNQSNLASTRTGVLLYIVLRAFTMKHYAGGG